MDEKMQGFHSKHQQHVQRYECIQSIMQFDVWMIATHLSDQSRLEWLGNDSMIQLMRAAIG